MDQGCAGLSPNVGSGLDKMSGFESGNFLKISGLKNKQKIENLKLY
jgi:hypothetical protein